MLQELQHEVSSLLEFKNAVLETFPHLHSRFGGVSPSAASAAAHRPLSAQPHYPNSPAPPHLVNSSNNNARSGSPHVRGSPGLGLPQPYRAPPSQASATTAVADEEEWTPTQTRGGAGLRRGPGSKPPPVVIRKSPENSNSSSGSGPTTGLAADSGFNSEPKDIHLQNLANGNVSTAHLLATRMMQHHHHPPNTPPHPHHLSPAADPLDVRWSDPAAWQATAHQPPQPRYMVYPQQGIPSQIPQHVQQLQQPQTHPPGGGGEVSPSAGDGDELMFLFDVIRKKTERLKSDFEEIKMQVSMNIDTIRLLSTFRAEVPTRLLLHKHRYLYHRKSK